MIRVAYLIVDLEIGGAQRLLEWIAPHLDRKRFSCEVMVLTGPAPLGKSIEASGIPVRRFGMKGRWDVRVVPRLVSALRRFRPHVLHTHLFHANVLGRICGRLTGVPHIRSTLHTLEGKPGYDSLERLTWWLGNSIEFVSIAVAEHARRASGLRGQVFRYGVPSHPAGAAPTGVPVVVTAARLVPGKGIDDLMAAISTMRGRTVKLRILGDGPDGPRLKRLASELRVDAEFAGWREDVCAAMSGCAVAAFPSRLGEGASIAAIEAMLAGVPVVASDVGGMPEVVDREWLVRPGDTAGLAEKIGYLLDHPAEARVAAERGRRRALEDFTLEGTLERLSEAYTRAFRLRPLDPPI